MLSVPTKNRPSDTPALMLWALCQSHRFGVSIVAEVLAPNLPTAERLFDRELYYKSETHGSFTISRLHLPDPWPPNIKDPRYKPRVVRIVHGITSAPDTPPTAVSSPDSPFLPKGVSPEEFYGEPLDYSKIRKGPIPQERGVVGFSRSGARYVSRKRLAPSAKPNPVSEPSTRTVINSPTVTNAPFPAKAGKPTSRFGSPSKAVQKLIASRKSKP